MESNNNESINNNHRQFLNTLLIGALIILGVLGVGRETYMVLYLFPSTYILDHFQVIIGLPVGAAVSLGIVTLLRQTEGKVQLKLPTLEINGAGGPIILWVICYLSIAFSIWLLWK